MMVFSTIQRIEQFDVGISSIRGTFEMVTAVSKMDEGVLLSVPNPGYAGKIKKFLPPRGYGHDDDDTNSELGASRHSRIKTDTK